jgi:hypothetical protein
MSCFLRKTGHCYRQGGKWLLFTLFIISQGYLLYKLVTPVKQQTKKVTVPQDYYTFINTGNPLPKEANPHV